MAENILTKQFVGLERPTTRAHADRTTTEPRQSLALDEAPEPLPLQQYRQETDEVTEPTPDNATRCAGNSSSASGLQRSSSTNTRARSSTSIASRRSSSTSMRSIEIAHWTNSFVLYTPVPPPRPRQPYQPVDPDPPSLPPLMLGSSISDGLLPVEPPVFQPLPDIPELPNLDFPWMFTTTDALEGADTELRSFEDVCRSPSTKHGSADGLDDDTGSSNSTCSDSDGSHTSDFSRERDTLSIDKPAPDPLSLEYDLVMEGVQMSTDEQSCENPPAAPAGSTAKHFKLHNKLVVMPDLFRKKKPVAFARFEPPVVPVDTRSFGTNPQPGELLLVSSGRSSLVTTSEYDGGCICYRC